MDKSSHKTPGTDFTIQMSISRISAFIGGGLLMGIAKTSGYSGAMTPLIIICFLSAVIICFNDGLEKNDPL